MLYTPDALPQPHVETEPLSYLARARVAMGGIGLAGAMLLAPEAASAEPVAISHSKAMSAKEVFQTCQENVRVVAHETSDPNSRSRFSVNTLAWMKHEIKKGHNVVEVDSQVSSDGTFFGFHDRLLNANTRNGHGVAHQKSSKYLTKLRTRTGDRLSNADDLISVLQRNPKVMLQHEFKNYDQQWRANRLKAWFNKFNEAGVLSQINVSSASPRVIEWFTDNHPEDVLERQFIGFGNHLPSLKLAKKIGATQVNVTSEAGFRNNAQYLKQAKRMGLRTSVRSRPDGRGDDGATWLRAIQNGVDQLVTQGPTKYFVCRAVQKAARRS